MGKLKMPLLSAIPGHKATADGAALMSTANEMAGIALGFPLSRK
jgi:hypothetical protein